MKVYSTEIEQRNGARRAETESDAQAIGDIDFLLTRVARLEEEKMRLKEELSDAIKTAEKHYDNSIREMQRATGKQEAVQRMKEALINKVREKADHYEAEYETVHEESKGEEVDIERKLLTYRNILTDLIAELEKVEIQLPDVFEDPERGILEINSDSASLRRILKQVE